MRGLGLESEAVRSLLPTLAKLNIASPGNVNIENLADCIRNEVMSRRAVVVSYGLVGAWGKKAVA